MAPHPSLCDTLSPRSEGKVTLVRDKLIRNTNFLLAPWGENARRAGEGLLGLYFLYDRTKQENSHSDSA